MKRTQLLPQTMLFLITGLASVACGGRTSPAEPAPRPAGHQGGGEGAYATQDREGLLGAVSAVPLDETGHVHDVLEMLRAHVPGVQVTELPDGAIVLRIRGQQQGFRTDEEANQPLLVIDGMPILPSTAGRALQSLVPSQIASVQVLRDVASTAVYGRKGANGVILIRMKRGW